MTPKAKGATPNSIVDVNSDPALQGVWALETWDGDGKRVPMARLSRTLTFDASRHVLRRGSKVSINDGYSADPQAGHLDLAVQDSHRPCIYKITAEQLTLCMGPLGGKRPTEFATRPGDNRDLIVFRRLHDDMVDRKVSRQQLMDFLQRFESALVTMNRNEIHPHIDESGMLDAATKGYGVPENARLSFLGGLNSTRRKSVAGLLATPPSNTYDRVLIKQHVATGWQVTYRQLCGLAFPVYLTFRVDRDAYGGVRITDMENHNAGATLSKTFRDVMYPGIASLSPSVMKNATPDQRARLSAKTDLADLGKALQVKDVRTAMRLLDRLPEALRTDTSLMWRTHVAAQGTALHGKTLERFRTEHPSNIMPLTVYFDSLKPSDLEDAHQTLRLLAGRVGADKYLKSYHAKLHLRAGERDKAASEARAACEATRDEHHFPQLVLLEVLLDSQQFDEAKTVYAKLVEHVPLETLLAIPNIEQLKLK